jgi:uncharacterized SAM-binding protein YcdF (DUF218 family)
MGLGAAILLAALLVVRRIAGMYFLFQFLLVAGGVIVLYGALWWASNEDMPGRRVYRVVRRVMEIGFGVWLLSFVVLELVILSGSRTDAVPNADYLVVLGAGLRADEPSSIFAARLDAAAQYLRDNPDTLAVVTGGIGSNSTVSEAAAGARYLEARGIAPERIYREETSTSTSENIRFALELIPDGAVTIMATNEFHVFRARWIARRNGLNAFGLAAPTPRADLRYVYYLREYFSVVFMLLGRY